MSKLISTDPGNGDVIWQGVPAGPVQVNAAVEAARKALPAWSALTIDQRSAYLTAFAQAVEENKEKLATAISREVGKPLWESRTEVAAVAGKIPISITAHKERCGERATTAPLGKSITRHKPHGVVAVFGPYNFPAHLPNGHIVPALIAGNTVVLKPSPFTPLVAETMVQLWESVGLPKGVLNLVQGGKETGIALSQHPGIDGLLFTGSANTGKFLSQEFAAHPEKMLALELGGNNPLVVMPGVDRRAAAYATIQSAFLTSGQRCTCARRLIVPHGKEGNTFLITLQEMMSQITVGHYLSQPVPFMGPVINEATALTLLKAIAWMEERGADTLIPMRHLQQGTGLVSPCLIDVTPIAHRTDEEYFGPLLQVVRVANLSEAIVEANNTRYGLSAGIFTPSEEEYQTFYHGIRAGIVNWNTQLTGASSNAPFGGVGQSGNHRPSAYYAADYCSYPVASMENITLTLPEKPLPGLIL